MFLLLLFIGVPLIEIALFIQVGGAIGLGWTLLVVVATALAGTYLVRAQGMQTLAEIRGSLDRFRDPTEPLAHGAMIVFSGALLLTPGFFTDAVGLSLLVPAVRRAVFRYVRARMNVQTVAFDTRRGPSAEPGSGPIEADYVDLTDAPDDAPSDTGPGSSGWRRH